MITRLTPATSRATDARFYRLEEQLGGTWHSLGLFATAGSARRRAEWCQAARESATLPGLATNDALLDADTPAARRHARIHAPGVAPTSGVRSYRYLGADELDEWQRCLLRWVTKSYLAARRALARETGMFGAQLGPCVTPRLFIETSPTNAHFKSTPLGALFDVNEGISVLATSALDVARHNAYHETHHAFAYAAHRELWTGPAYQLELEAERFARRHCGGCGICIESIESSARVSAAGSTRRLKRTERTSR